MGDFTLATLRGRGNSFFCHFFDATYNVRIYCIHGGCHFNEVAPPPSWALANGAASQCLHQPTTGHL